MNFDRLIRTIGQALGEAMAESGKFRFQGDNENEADGWSSFDALSLEGGAPTKLKVALSGKDRVRVTDGDGFVVMVDGEDIDALRFRRDGDTLRIRRRRSGAPCTVGITIPALREVAVAGGGTVEAARLTGVARVAIGGSGEVRIDKCDCDLVTAKIGGSGRIALAGRSEALEVAIGGSGHFVSPGLAVDIAEVRIGGSGKASFACDGAVEARIGGSGDIVVHGSPRVSLKSGGSGRLTTIPQEAAGDEAA
ncbi:GIN domain-containing protein [Aurantiacibacter luteus]|uniref:GIN domain-containing protein n=1 Tax=Aurantiacibacter luteus TaxID=1581420 RepID=UPI000ABBADD8|nr:DUF2807 domain-containing protein [Aurantiacibacter luteus]